MSMEVRELMTENVVSITPEESAALAARLLAWHNLGALPVCDSDQRVQGIVTDRDIVVRCVAAEKNPADQKVKDIMSSQMESVSPDDHVKRAAHIMAGSQIRRLPVVEAGKLVGMISLGDIAKSHSCHMEAAEALSEISENCRKAK